MATRPLLVLPVLVILVFACGCLQASSPAPTGTGTVAPPLSPAANTTTVPDLVTHVARAAAYARENGRERATTGFGDPNGPFSIGQAPIYARDYNGTVLAAAPGTGPAGTAGLEATDAFGVPIIRNMGETARYGGGYVSHTTPDPDLNGTIEPAIEVVEDVDGTYYVGAGISASGSDLVSPTVMDITGEQPGVDVLEAFVHEAAAYAREHGRDAAVEAFDDPSGRFVRGQLVVTAFDFNATVLACPTGAFGFAQSGVNLLNYHDPDGVAVIRGMRDLARSGGGLLYTVNPVAVDGRRVFLPKVVSVEPVDGDWWLSAGIIDPAYAGSAGENVTGLPVRNETRTRLYDLVIRAVAHAREHGKERTLEAINDPAGPFVEGNLFAWAESTDGTMLADPFWKSAIGQNYMDYTDLYGLKTTRVGIDAMQHGTGFSHALFPDTAANGSTWVPKLVYQLAVDEDWWIGSGVYGVEVR